MFTQSLRSRPDAPETQKAESQAYSAENRPFGDGVSEGIRTPDLQSHSLRAMPSKRLTDKVLTATPPDSCTSSCTAEADPGRLTALQDAIVAVLSGAFAPDLARLILVWPSLDATTRAIIVNLVGSVNLEEDGRRRRW